MSRKPMLAIGVAAALTLGMTAAQAQNSNSSTMSKPAPASSMNGSSGMNKKASKAEQHFLTEAMQGDMAEVQLGKLAQQKGQSEDVKQFGQMLEQDHSQHLQQAQQEAQQLGVTAPQQLDAKHKATYERMSKLTGAQFDKQFTKHEVADHKKDIAEYQKQAKSKGPLAQFAQQTVPVLQKHLQTAQAAEGKGATAGAKSGVK
jgi:putative membrane protein